MECVSPRDVPASVFNKIKNKNRALTEAARSNEEKERRIEELVRALKEAVAINRKNVEKRRR